MKLVDRIIVLIFMFSLVAGIVSAAAVSAPDFQVTLEEQNPDPVEPGEVVTLELKIENDGTETTEDVIIKIDPKYPFTLYDSSNSQNIGRMRNGEVVTSVDFRLLVDDLAAQGDAEVAIFVGEENSGKMQEFVLNIDIETRDAVLDISAIEIIPKRVAPGQEFDLLVTLSNEADSLLQSIYATVNTTSGGAVASYFSSSEKVISSMSSGEKITLQYKLLVDPSYEHGLYRIPFSLDYEDRNGNSYSTTEHFSLFVVDESTIDLQVRNSVIWDEDRSGKVTFELANLGQGELKAVQLEILENNNYKLLSSQNRFYIGNVDSDDTETEEVQLAILNSELEEVEIKVLLSYMDALNTEFKEEISLNLPIYTKDEAIELGITEKESSFGLIVMIIVALVIALWYYRKNMKGKKNSSNKKSVK